MDMSDNVEAIDRENADGKSKTKGVAAARAKVQEGVSAAKDRLQSVGGGLSDRARSVSGEVRDRAGLAGEKAKEGYGVAKEKLGEGYQKARKDLGQLTTDVDAYVRDNPGRSIVVAAAAGFLVGFLLSPNRRR